MFHGGNPSGRGRLRSALDADTEELPEKIYDWRIIARLPKYLAPVKFWLVLGGSGMVLRSLAALASPYLIAIATDRFIQTGNLAGLNSIIIAFIGAALLVWGGQYLETLFLSYAGEAMLLRLRNEMFDHLQQLSLSFYDRNEVGKIMSRVQNDVQQLQELLTGGILNLSTSALTLLGIAIAMVMMNARLALLTLTVVPALGLVIFIWQKHAHLAFLRVRRAIATVNAQLQESISGVRVIQSLSREEINYQQFDSVNKTNLSANLNATKLSAIMMPTEEIVAALATGLVIVFGGYQVLAGTMGIGILLGFLLYIQRFFAPVQELIMEYTDLQRAMVAAERVFELLDIEPEITDSPQAIEMPPVKGGIKFCQVSFSYEPNMEILHDIDLTINPGETVAIVGRTGAGKSSLANLIARFYEIDKGEITIDDYKVTSVTQHSLRRQIGLVTQDPFLFSGSILENIRYGRPEATPDEVSAAAKTVGAHDFIIRLKQGYETPVGQRGGNLSAGQRQFICLARAILAKPPILILDEATSNVDTNAERLMQKSFHHLLQGRTCLIIAHRLSTVTNADRIIVLEHGKIAEMGSHQELLAKRSLFYNMLMALNTPDIVPQNA